MPLRHPRSTCAQCGRGKCFQFEYRKPHANSLTESNVYTHNTKHTRNYLFRQLGLRIRNAIQLLTRTVTVCSMACEYERGFCRLLHFPHEWVETFVRAMHTHTDTHDYRRYLHNCVCVKTFSIRPNRFEKDMKLSMRGKGSV